MSGNEKVLAFPVYPGVTPLDLVGPLMVLQDAGLPNARYRTVVVGEHAEPLATDTPLELLPAATFAEVPDPWAVIVPGGEPPPWRRQRTRAAVLRPLGRAGAQVVGSTGNGALVLAAADLLAGRRAAIHWAFREPLESSGAIPARRPVAGRRPAADRRRRHGRHRHGAAPAGPAARREDRPGWASCPRSTTRSRRSAGCEPTVRGRRAGPDAARPRRPGRRHAGRGTNGTSPSCCTRG